MDCKTEWSTKSEIILKMQHFYINSKNIFRAASNFSPVAVGKQE